MTSRAADRSGDARSVSPRGRDRACPLSAGSDRPRADQPRWPRIAAAIFHAVAWIGATLARMVGLNTAESFKLLPPCFPRAAVGSSYRVKYPSSLTFPAFRQRRQRLSLNLRHDVAAPRTTQRANDGSRPALLEQNPTRKCRCRQLLQLSGFRIFRRKTGQKKACTPRRILSLKNGATLCKKASSIIPLYETVANHRQLRRL